MKSNFVHSQCSWALVLTYYYFWNGRLLYVAQDGLELVILPVEC